MPAMLRLATTLLATSLAAGPTTTPPADESSANATAAGLDPAPWVAEPLGLQMHVPAGAVITAQVVQGRVSYLISGTRGGSAWSMRIGSVTSTLAQASASALVDEQFRAVEATGRPYRILANEPRRYGDVDGQLLYLEQTLETEAKVSNGWLILPTSPQTFLVFFIVTGADHFGRLRPVFDASFATIKLRSPNEMMERRRARLAQGQAIIKTFSPDRLRSVLGQLMWYRIYQPAASGNRDDDIELGYLSMQCSEAMRGAVDPQRSPDTYSTMESQPGLMVLIEARGVLDAQAKRYLDVQGRYWMAWDRSEETWSNLQTHRDGEASRTVAETGIRTAPEPRFPHGTLTVIHSSKERFTRDPKEWSIPNEAYLSQPEVFMLGSLLPRDGTLTGEMAFYYYDSRLQRLPQRVDRWEPAKDGSGNWVLTTQPALDAGSITQTFDSAGHRIKRIDANATVTQRIDPAELRRLWLAKGLLAP